MFQNATTAAIGEYRDIEKIFNPSARAVNSDWIHKRFVVIED